MAASPSLPRATPRRDGRRRRLDSAERLERKEDLLRPSPWLGYDREQLAAHLLARGALGLAEGQLRRCVWLNPFEPRFKARLAWCLHLEGKDGSALEQVRAGLAVHPGDLELRRMLVRLRPGSENSGEA